ncbi:hypothetical protein [Pseudomonas sp. NPDC086278]|uniref:hypothetical protein n=1 Tax=Pseudomonas sp. NPDC086278 TaxID=3390646 RepID=UPI003CFFC689
MLQSGYINFFEVNKCGLYRLFNETPKALELEETIAKLKDWKEGRNFEATNPWDPKRNRNKTPCFCHEIHHNENTGDFLLVLWKGDSDRHGPLYGITINPDGSTEKAIKQTQTNSKKPMVWGRPSYYWVIPELNIIASIKFENSRCDSAMFQDWVTGCINLRVDLPDHKKTLTEKGFTRIQMPDGDADQYRYSFQFDLSMKSLSTSSAEMTELTKRVTHIIRRETVTIKNVDKRKGFAKFFQRFEVPYISAENQSTRRVELKIEAKPTVEEIKQIITQYASDHEAGTWEDVGFSVDNTTKTVWASKYRLTENISVEDHGEPILTAERLYATILGNRDKYLDPIRKDLELDSIKQAAAHA